MTQLVLTEAQLEALKNMLGEEAVLTSDHDVEPFGRDETEDLFHRPGVVVRPRTTEEVSTLLRWASEENLPVTPRGGGTGLSGGALPVRGGVLLSLDRMNRILEVDEANRAVHVEAGVIVETLHDEVERHGLFYGPDPASRASCTIGGNVAENAGGARALKYGCTRESVLGLEAVLMGGEIIRTGGKLLKDVAGYDLTGLLVGSEGTLAVVTRIWLRLHPLPRHRRTMLCPFPGLDEAAAAVPAIIAEGIVPRALEVLERAAVDAAQEHLGLQLPGCDAEAVLLIELDGNDAEALEAQAMVVGELCLEHGADDCHMPESAARMDEIWAMRRAVGEAVKKSSVYKEEDTVVPPSCLPELVRGTKAICARAGVTVVCYGHAGDGNMHMNLLKGDLDDGSWEARLPGVIHEIFELCIGLGGSITGEHGVGLTQRPYLPMARNAATLAVMARLKTAFDPKGLLNPDKVLP